MKAKTGTTRRHSLRSWLSVGRLGRISAIGLLFRQYDRMLPLAFKIAVPLVVISVTAATWLGSTMIAATRESFARTYAAQAEGIAQLVASGYASNSADQQAFTVFLTDISKWGEMNVVYHQYFPKDPPARSTVAVAALPGDSPVEIECIAYVG